MRRIGKQELTLDEVIEVEMDNEWKMVEDTSDRLVTYGVSSCIAVAVGDDEGERLWLIHSPVFGHDNGNLIRMLKAAQARNSGKLKVLVLGGDPSTKEIEEEVLAAREAAESAFKTVLPEVEPEIRWGTMDAAEFYFDQGGWRYEGALEGPTNW